MIDPPSTARRRVYLDHGATSFPKPVAVWEAVIESGQTLGAPAGRGAYREAALVDRWIEKTRGLVARLLGAKAERVVFTLNGTDSLNIALKGTLQPGDHVVTTVLEHNSVLRPLAAIERDRAITVTRVRADREGRVRLDDIARAITFRTRLVAVTHASNVCGTILPIRAIGEVARRAGAHFLVDAAQTAGTVPIHMEEDGIDLLCAPGHKGLLGPPGTGVLAVRDGVEVTPWREGGSGTRSEEPEQPSDYPMRLEAGSPNVPGIAGLGAGVEHLLREGVPRVHERLQELGRSLWEGLERIPGLWVGGPRDLREREPIFPINVEGFSPHDLAAALDASFGVQCRAGLHCAPLAHEALGTAPGGSCRLSLGSMSTQEDVGAAIAAVAAIAKR